MKLASVCYWSVLLTIASSAMAQQVSPQSSAPCSGATARICPILNWPQFHFDSAHTGFNPNETILSPANVGNLVLDWKYQAPPYFDRFPSSPDVVGGAVYFGGEGWGNVYSVDAQTGQTRWIWANNGSEAPSTAVAYGKVYAADYDRETIEVLDAGNGHLLGRWGYDTPAALSVADGAIYVASFHIGNYHTGNVYAMDANTGEIFWNRFMQSGVVTSPAVANGKVYVEFTTTTGAKAQVSLCAMDASSGTILWQFAPQGVSGYFPPAVSNDVVYAGASIDGQGYIYAVDAVTGGMLWRSQLPVGGSSQLTTPAVANGVVYLGFADDNDDSYGYMYGFDAHTGALLWNFNAAGGIYSSAAVANGVVYFGSDDMNVYALDAGTGALLWNYTTGGQVASSPAVVNGIVYIGSDDMYMYAFHLPPQ